MIWLRWTLTVISLNWSSAAICLFGRPVMTSVKTLRSRGVREFEALAQFGDDIGLAPPCAIAFDSHLNRVEQLLLVEWLGQKLDRP